MVLERVGRGSALASPGSLLRAWRTEMGWTQDDVALTVRVSRAAVTSWETDTRRIPAQALEDLDFAYVAGGCLADLVRAVGSVHGTGDWRGTDPHHGSADERSCQAGTEDVGSALARMLSVPRAPSGTAATLSRAIAARAPRVQFAGMAYPC